MFEMCLSKKGVTPFCGLPKGLLVGFRYVLKILSPSLLFNLRGDGSILGFLLAAKVCLCCGGCSKRLGGRSLA